MDEETGGNACFEFTDVGGQRSERKKWMRLVDEDINCCVYVAAIAEYDMTCFEDDSTNRLQEGLDLFEQIAKLKFFEGKTLVIFLNKYGNFLPFCLFLLLLHSYT